MFIFTCIWLPPEGGLGQWVCRGGGEGDVGKTQLSSQSEVFVQEGYKEINYSPVCFQGAFLEPRSKMGRPPRSAQGAPKDPQSEPRGLQGEPQEPPKSHLEQIWCPTLAQSASGASPDTLQDPPDTLPGLKNEPKTKKI